MTSKPMTHEQLVKAMLKNPAIKQLFFCKFHELVLRRCAHAAGQGFIVR